MNEITPERSKQLLQMMKFLSDRNKYDIQYMTWERPFYEYVESYSLRDLKTNKIVATLRYRNGTHQYEEYPCG